MPDARSTNSTAKLPNGCQDNRARILSFRKSDEPWQTGKLIASISVPFFHFPQHSSTVRPSYPTAPTYLIPDFQRKMMKNGRFCGSVQNSDRSKALQLPRGCHGRCGGRARRGWRGTIGCARPYWPCRFCWGFLLMDAKTVRSFSIFQYRKEWQIHAAKIIENLLILKLLLMLLVSPFHNMSLFPKPMRYVRAETASMCSITISAVGASCASSTSGEAANFVLDLRVSSFSSQDFL